MGILRPKQNKKQTINMDKTPDSWDNGQSQGGLSGLSISAKPFVPNVNAVSFVPGGSYAPPAAKPAPAPAPAEEEVATNGDDETTDNWDDGADEEEEVVQENGISEEVNGATEVEEEKEQEQEEELEEPEDEVEEEIVKEVAPTKKSKTPSPEPDDGRENINIIFIGHVDAGKSTIGG